MADVHDRQELLRENLKDAKCSKALLEQCLAFSEAGQEGRMLERLSSHRSHLLGQLHGYQKALDCLDYLLFRLEKECRS